MTIIEVPGDTACGDFAGRPNAALVAAECGVAVLDVVVPVYNEEADLANSIRRLHQYLSHDFPFTFQITIDDNAGIDDTPGATQ